ncbi:hypothetical protein DEA06_16155 [Microbacterium sp. Gd 4-13]|uniref:hypothetical protein n=1 Tax=Microbacterium sp. Gd 4-13 TaxID=2173179 RepID=UPI000D56E684|nr:hypothetical protein [Microbacterium sp. Gd 4-13]PVW02024.1 hypothetical protein DEA06_16155 [Microbacterium sp. Gd 4-13]
MNAQSSPREHPARSRAPLAAQIVSAVLLALTLCLSSWAGGHSADDDGSFAEILTASATGIAPGSAPLSDTPPGIAAADSAGTLMSGAVCVFGLLCGVVFFAVLRRARLLRGTPLLTRAAVTIEHSWPRILFLAPPLTLSQLAILRN